MTEQPTETLVSAERHGPVALLTLEHVGSYNALGRDLVAELTGRLTDAAADPDVRVVVVTGAGPAFCAGADIAEVPAMIGAAPTDELPFDRLFDVLTDYPTPTVAAVRGIAYGGGCELALACDIAIAGHSARFAVPEVKLGVIPGAGGTQRLVHAVGKAKAMRMLLSGDAVDAAWACDAGRVADVVDDDEVVPAAIGLARRIAGNAPRAVALAADAARRAHDQPLREGLATERHNFLRALGTDDAREGLSAFTAGRTPAFTGR